MKLYLETSIQIQRFYMVLLENAYTNKEIANKLFMKQDLAAA